MSSPATRQLWQQMQADPNLPISPALNPFLYTLPRELWNKVKEPWEPAVNVALGASLPGQGSFQVDGNSWFCIMGAIATVRDTTNATVITSTPELVQIEIQSSGEKFFSEPTDFLNVFGTAQEPAWWSFPRICNPASVVQISLTNLEATARNVRMLFKGFRIWNRNLVPA